MTTAINHSVLLIHGLWNKSPCLWPLAYRLRQAGFRPRYFDYASVLHTPDRSVMRLIARLRRSPQPLHVVAHSLGGLLIMEALNREPDLPIARVVCLGSPLRGSRAAHYLAKQRWGSWFLGGSREWLCSGVKIDAAIPPIGMIAGCRARGLGRVVAAFPGASDGTVAVDETVVPGLADHCLLAVSHSGLLLSAEVARHCVHFLQYGRFAG